MSRQCGLTGTKPISGNNVSHSNRKTRRRFSVNVQHVTLFSDVLKKKVPLKVTAATLRSVDHNGGLDNYLVTAKAANLTPEAQALRRKVKKALLAAGKAPQPRARSAARPSAKSRRAKKAA